MEKDFTQVIYKRLLLSVIEAGYSYNTFERFILGHNLSGKSIILRHDVDRRPQNALKLAIIEHSFGIKASYYFRIVKESYDESIIKEIVSLGHEIGYHYEDLSLTKGNYETAIRNFQSNLEKLRAFYPVKTICMHGSPLSKIDNRLIWQKYNYRDYGIIGEPYFDLDFNEILYLTDTGRRWNGQNVSIRDKVISNFDYDIKTTNELIQKIEEDALPNKIMINVHPHRWFDNSYLWIRELIFQNVKNYIKFIIAYN